MGDSEARIRFTFLSQYGGDSMDDSEARREICNIMEYSSGFIVCLDQNRMPMNEYYGPKEKVLPLLKSLDLSRARIKRRAQEGIDSKWEFISLQELLEKSGYADWRHVGDTRLPHPSSAPPGS
jgi:hypothetical protein